MQQAIHVIDRRRKELGLSVAELCRLANMPEATYRNMVSGRSLNQPFPTIRSLSLGVNMTLDELVSLMDDEASPKTAEALSNIAQTPATTQEVDTGFTLLSRTIEKNAADYQTELRLLKDHFEQLAVAKDAMFARERKYMTTAILALLALCAALIVVICIELVV